MDMNLHIPVSNFEFIDDNDDHFLKVRVQVIANGENLNRSDFDKDGMEASKDTFRGKPLLCAFPKNRYTNEYKIGDGHNASDIKYDSEYNEFYRSYLDPNSERMVGYIPQDSNIVIEFIDGKYWICMDAVILRKYNHELVNDILKKKSGKSKRDNKRISAEIEVISSHMRKHETEDYEVEVIDMFKGMGITILFDDTQEAIVGANLKAFSESDQYNKFKSFMQSNFSNSEFIDKEKIGTGEKITIKKDKVSNTPWGDVDKSALYKKALDASNYRAVVRFIYAKIEDGWEDNPSEKLKYPIGQISGGEAFYNKGGLASALGYSKASGDSDVTAKVERIRKRLDIDDESEEYAVEKNTDILDGTEVVSNYPDELEMSDKHLNEKEFGLTMGQKKEIINIALSQVTEDDDEEDRHCSRYWICDLDDDYIYVQDYQNDYRMYRVRYILDQENKTAEVYIETKEEVICSGYEVVGRKEEEGVNEEFNKEESLEEETLAEDGKEEETLAEDGKEEETLAEDVDTEELADDGNKEEDMAKEEPDNDPDDDESGDDAGNDTKEIKNNEAQMSEISLESETVCESEVLEKCNGAGCMFICKAGEYVVYSVGDKLFSSKMDNFEEKFEVSLEMKFNITTVNVGGVIDGEPQTVAPVRVSFEKSFAEITSALANTETKSKKYESDIAELENKLRSYKSKELSNKFDEISFDSNITVAEKSEWKNRINKNEFSSEDELVEKFGGFVFKKKMDSRSSTYNSETVRDTSNNKKSYEEIIDRYMTGNKK